MEAVFFHPTWQGGDRPETVEVCEDLLAEHFGHECVVTGSGRSAIDLVLRHAGLNRYRNRLALTPMISRCVLDVAVMHAYPVDPSATEKYDLVLRYHQMGIPQNPSAFSVPIIDDICHAFFADPTECVPKVGSGWAVFSLPKFFPMAGMAGGIVLRDQDEARELRRLRDRSAPLSDEEQRSQAQDFQRGYGGDAHFSDRLELLYLKRRLNSRCHPQDLAGFPTDSRALKALHARRRAVMQRLLGSLNSEMFPPAWYPLMQVWLPFALPVFLESETRMNAVVQRLNAQGISCGIYSIDVARNQEHPDLRRAVVVPCHQHLSDQTCDAIVSALSGSFDD